MNSPALTVSISESGLALRVFQEIKKLKYLIGDRDPLRPQQRVNPE